MRSALHVVPTNKSNGLGVLGKGQGFACLLLTSAYVWRQASTVDSLHIFDLATGVLVIERSVYERPLRLMAGPCIGGWLLCWTYMRPADE